MPVTIIVKRRPNTNDYYGIVEGDKFSEIVAVVSGDTQEQVIGEIVRSHAKKFGVVIKTGTVGSDVLVTESN